MEKRQKAAQIYGYAVCLVTLITFLICLGILVSQLFDLSDPLKSRGSRSRSQGPSLASFDNYKMDITMSLPEGQQLPDDQTLQRMYEAARQDIIESIRYRAYREMTVNLVIILVSVILFIIHWTWMRRLSRAEAT